MYIIYMYMYCIYLFRSSDEGGTGEHHDYFPATRLFEYRWPPEQEKAELYFLQEQVAEFLQIRGIQRKYPGMCDLTLRCALYCILSLPINTWICSQPAELP